MNEKCIKHSNCPIFSGLLKDKTMTAKAYQNQYCLAGESGWSKCKRFLVSNKYGKCPPNLLPNSLKSVDEIIEEMKKEGK
jgi:hypothetical protein